LKLLSCILISVALCQFLTMIKLKFDVIILSEIWVTNLEFYHILPEYNLVYDVPVKVIVEGIGMFINRCCVFREMPELKLHCSNVEDIWCEIVKYQISRNTYLEESIGIPIILSVILVLDYLSCFLEIFSIHKAMGAGTGGAGWASAHPGKNQGGHGPPCAHPGNFSRGLKTSWQ